MADGTTYSAGNLEFQIQAMGNDTTATFSKINSSLNTMINLLGHSSSALKTISKTARSMSRMTFNWTEKLAKGLTNITNIDTQAFYQKMSSLTRIMEPFVSQLNQAQTSLVALQKVLSSTTGKRTIQMPTISNESKQANQSGTLGALSKLTSKGSALSIANLVNKVYFLRNYTKQMFRNIFGIVEKAVDYTETLNLWQVAMRKNRDEAEQFINTMNKAYGISTQTLMNYQAIFRNMLSSLGGISEITSYALSEYLTQMALDYASLYNTSIEKAMTTFQAVLSGQVRPIRSIAGYDITETTIYQLYQQLGGTKTMRQLTQTEKRLLRIYAVFQQMESSGAIGDLAKTLDNTANQMRIFTESTKELGTWLGIWLESFIKPILPYLNAFVITLTNIVKAIVKMKGIEMFEGGIESVQEFNEELDEITGKLLSFDRFEALNSTAGADNNMLGIDESLLAGLSKYQSILDGVTGKAQELAETWTNWFVERDAEGNIVRLTDKAKLLLDVLKALGITLGGLIVLGIGKKIISLLKSITGLTTGMKSLNFVIMTGIVFAIIQAVDAFKKGDVAGGILATTIGVVLAGAFIYFNRVALMQVIDNLGVKFLPLLLNLIGKTGSYGLAITSLTGSFIALGVAIAGAFLLIKNWGDMNTWQKIVGVIGLATTAILGLAMALGAFHSAWSLGLAVAGIVAGIAMMTASIASVKKSISQPVGYATGGLVEDGLFQMSKGEIIGDFDDGTTVVANNQQIIQGIQQGVYSAVVSAMRQSGGNGGVGNVYIDGRKVGMATARSSHNENIRTGLVRVNS